MRLFSVILAAIYLAYPIKVSETPKSEQKSTPIELSLPKIATIELEDRTSISSVKITEINNQNEIVTIEKSGESKKLKLREIEKIIFRGEVILKGNDRLRFRGENSGSCGEKSTEVREPLSNFQLVETNRAEVKVSNSKQRNHLSSLNRFLTLVLDQISISESSQTVEFSLKIRPCSSNN